MEDGGGDSSRDLGNSGGKRKSNSDRQVSMIERMEEFDIIFE